MVKVILKNGLESEINVWNYDQLSEFSKRPDPQNFLFKGFDYFLDRTIYDLQILTSLKYSKEKNLSKFELHEDVTLENERYHRAIVSMVSDMPVGIMMCQWLKDSCSFWRYHIRFLDVRSDFRNNGVATSLIKQVDNVNFLKGRILQRGLLSDDGSRYSDKVFEREVKANDFALIPEDYALVSPPDTFGKFNFKGRLLS